MFRFYLLTGIFPEQTIHWTRSFIRSFKRLTKKKPMAERILITLVLKFIRWSKKRAIQQKYAKIEMKNTEQRSKVDRGIIEIVHSCDYRIQSKSL